MSDISTSKIVETNILEDDSAFLEQQREDRQSCSMRSVNTLHTSTIAKEDDEMKKGQMRKRKQV